MFNTSKFPFHESSAKFLTNFVSLFFARWFPSQNRFENVVSNFPTISKHILYFTNKKTRWLLPPLASSPAVDDLASIQTIPNWQCRLPNLRSLSHSSQEWNLKKSCQCFLRTLLGGLPSRKHEHRLWIPSLKRGLPSFVKELKLMKLKKTCLSWSGPTPFTIVIRKTICLPIAVPRRDKEQTKCCNGEIECLMEMMDFPFTYRGLLMLDERNILDRAIQRKDETV